MFVFGIFAVIIFVIFLCLITPQRIPFVAKSTALFFLIRSVFVSLTHIGLYPNIIETNINILKSLTSGGDLFLHQHPFEKKSLEVKK